MRRSALGVACGVLACGLVSLATGGQADAQQAPKAVWLHGEGATFPAPLYERWIKAYQKLNPGTFVNYSAVGSGEGINRFMSGAVDFAGSDAAISDEAIAKVNRGVLVIPATAGMVVLAYNIPGYTGELKLPRDVYADIFSGAITRWNDPRILAANPDLPSLNRSIAVVARRESSGTTFAFTSHLASVTPAWQTEEHKAGKVVNWPSGAMLVMGNEGVAGRIKQSEWSIGYVEYGFAKRLNLPMAALENKAGQFVKPEENSGREALSEASSAPDADLRIFIPDPAGPTAYPIVTYTWLLLYKQYADDSKRVAVQDFVKFGLTAGQTMGEDLGYIVLPDAISEKGQQELALLGKGNF